VSGSTFLVGHPHVFKLAEAALPEILKSANASSASNVVRNGDLGKAGPFPS
jgi:hypothetical protein